MAQTAQTKKKRKKKKRKKQSSRSGVLIAVLVATLILVVFVLFRFLRSRPVETTPEPEVSVSVAPTLPPSRLSAQCFGESDGYKTYISDTVTAKLGVDISSHQEWVDWEALAASPVDFVILRAGYRGYGDGSVNIDPYFAENLAAARNAGLGVGVYFFSQALTPDEAEEEARTVLSQLADYQIDYPIYYDWEPISDENARTATISATEITSCAQRFCQTIEQAGYRAGVYFNLDIALSYYHLTDLMDYEFWLAEYQDTPSYPFAFGMWQYSDQGTVPGVTGGVDMNLCFKSYGN